MKQKRRAQHKSQVDIQIQGACTVPSLRAQALWGEPRLWNVCFPLMLGNFIKLMVHMLFSALKI